MKKNIRTIVFTVLGFIWIPVFLINPVWSHWSGTFESASVEIIAEPYVESNVLRYTWKGYVVRSCPIVVERTITTSEGVVINLESSVFDAAADEDLGYTEQPRSVETPSGLPEGRTVYQPVERPKCDWLQRLWTPEVPYPPVVFIVTHKG